jgi:hypothetical protein
MRCIGDAISLCLLNDVVETGGDGPRLPSSTAQSLTCDVLVAHKCKPSRQRDRVSLVSGERTGACVFEEGGGGLIQLCERSAGAKCILIRPLDAAQTPGC